MKIAIDIRKIGKRSTGSETYFYYLVKELAKLDGSKKHDFFLLTDENPDKAKNILKPLPDNFKIYEVKPRNKMFWTFYSLPRFLKKKSIDILHVEYILPFYLRKKTKIVSTIHDVSFKVNPEWITKKDSYILNSFIPPSIKRADAIIAVSGSTKKEIIKYYNCSADKIFVTNPAVDSRYFFSINKKTAIKEVAKVLGPGFRQDDNFILHISSLQPRKNVPLIVSAFAQLKKKWIKSNSKWKDIKLVIVGDKKGHNYDKKIDGEILKRVQDDSINKNDIIITGYQPANKLPYFYKAAQVFVFPSAYEGFGIPLVEAMASETPIVASNIGVFKEVAGEAAIYVNIGKKDSVEKLAAAIGELIGKQKLREKKVKLGMERKELFSWKKLAEKTLGIYERLGM